MNNFREDDYFRSYGMKVGDNNNFDVSKVVNALNFIMLEFRKPVKKEERHLQFAVRLTHKAISKSVSKLISYIKEEK